MLRNYNPNRCYVVAEIGGNFNDFSQAKHLIDQACICGVDAIKLQTYTAEYVASKNAIFDMENTGIVSQYELFKKYEIGKDLHERIFDYIDSKKIDFFSTPSHETDVQLLETLGVSAYKIGSDDATNLPFLQYVAKKQLPVFLATGMCTISEVKEAVETILAEGNENLFLLHAVTSYPTHAEHVNLRAVHTMQRIFPELPIGYSDHTIGTTACICAAAMGAKVIEKHFTYDKKECGPDHMLSADPTEMKQIVDTIREFEIMYGSGIKRPADSEKNTRRNNRKSIVVTKSLNCGEVLTKENLVIKRPGTGIAPKFFEQVLGRVVNREIEEDSVLAWSDLK